MRFIAFGFYRPIKFHHSEAIALCSRIGIAAGAKTDSSVKQGSQVLPTAEHSDNLNLIVIGKVVNANILETVYLPAPKTGKPRIVAMITRADSRQLDDLSDCGFDVGEITLRNFNRCVFEKVLVMPKDVGACFGLDAMRHEITFVQRASSPGRQHRL